MLRKVVFGLFPLAVLACCASFTSAKAHQFVAAAVGELEYPAFHEPGGMVVWSQSSVPGNRSSTFTGRITENCKIHIVETGAITFDDMTLLNGRNVMAYGEFHTEGKGNECIVYCDKLTLIVLPHGYKVSL